MKKDTYVFLGFFFEALKPYPVGWSHVEPGLQLVRRTAFEVGRPRGFVRLLAHWLLPLPHWLVGWVCLLVGRPWQYVLGGRPWQYVLGEAVSSCVPACV